MDVDVVPRPWVPRIENLTHPGPVGVLASCSTTPDDLIHRLTGKPRIRPTSTRWTNDGGRIIEAETHLIKRPKLFRQTEPPLSSCLPTSRSCRYRRSLRSATRFKTFSSSCENWLSNRIFKSCDDIAALWAGPGESQPSRIMLSAAHKRV